MKNPFIKYFFGWLAGGSLMLASCNQLEKLNPFEKNEKEPLPCPVVEAAAVPQAVKKVFADKYPGAISSTWFNKDNIGYCVAFNQNNEHLIARFDNNGTFVSQETDTEGNVMNHSDDNVDSTAEDTGCSCETGTGIEEKG